MDPIVWSILCCILMVVAIAIEMFTPSFGILTCIGVGLIIASVYLAFSSNHGASLGFVMLAVNIVMLPLAILVGMQFMKYSPMAHRGDIPVGPVLELEHPESDPDLVGQEGMALTPLRPSGTVEVGERRLEVVSDGSFVEKGQRIRVQRVDGNIIVVEPWPEQTEA